jgi:hypothetical protein
MLDRQTHWLKVQGSLRYPRWIVTLDCEARIEYENTRQHHRLRCAVACFDRIDSETGEVEKTEWIETDDAAELWRWITERTKADRRTVVFAHNLGYDLMVTGALEQLPALGWQARHFSLDSYRCWARYMKGRRGLALVDTWSFYPSSLERIAGMLNLRKLALPAQDAPEEQWVARCRRDVEITRQMVLELLGYLERNELGGFKLTGPAQASAAFRHHFLREKDLLVHDHSAAIDAERAAASTGRVEAWRHGRQKGWIYEWDYRMAYAHLARRAQLPVKLLGFKLDLSSDDVARFRDHYELLCEVDVETEVPVIPTRTDNGILWPVGKFSSTCWDVELQLLESEGGSYHVRKAWIYKRAPALKEWADWIIGRLDGPKREESQLQQLMLKAWSRSLIGRFGLRYPNLEQIGTADNYEISIVPQLYGDSDELRNEIQIGRELFVQHGAVEGKDSMPALMSYVMAMGRVELWLAMRLAGLENVAYVDTDSLLVNAEGHARLLKLADASPSYNLRYVKRHSKVDVLGPRRLLLNGRPKIAGLPSSAIRVGADSWKVEMWESPRGAISRGRAAELVVSVHTFTLRSPDHRRRHLRAGRTGPYRIEDAAA